MESVVREIALGEFDKIVAVVSDEHQVLRGGVGELLFVAAAGPAGGMGVGGGPSTGAQQRGDQHVDVFVEIDAGEEAAHAGRERGSMSVSSMRLRSM